ncbi:hypothetical protein CTA2_12410 [Colletotrichum tanaceti]|uniref:Mtf2-like C-terminal domain-containing protein n=1 Tax=Colletotrichum tanaceti TaxID=1306861 RepID=A0A4U6XFF3_9PEZI|nr:hypothetical protein CTA2_12410 [Colletotrichum tanaceti]TKW54069.1 hypothetical protein CTA1_5635 [Colletotrichum tanaceti]
MSTLTPFLYQTRTILRASAALRSLSTSATRHRGEQPIPFEWDGHPADKRPDIPSGFNNPEKSTITPTEKHIFQRIFADIAERGDRGGVGAATAEQQDAELGQLGSRDAVLSKFPRSLRRAAQAALELREVRGQDPSSSRTSSKPEEEHLEQNGGDLEAEMEQAARLEAAYNEIRTTEIVRLQALLDQCNTDVEVWNVLERDVFSMVTKLGISEHNHPQPQPQSQSQAQTQPQTEKKGRGRPKKQQQQQQPEKMSDTESSELPLIMDSHGPLYSIHLLQGLKTLDQSFGRPSALALNLLPRVKELGLASYVLGASTPLYNELASIVWYRHGDAQAVLALLDEMQFAGLHYDEQTLRLIGTIEMALASFRRGHLGVFSKAIGAMPGYNLDVKAQVARYARRVRTVVKNERDQARY